MTLNLVIPAYLFLAGITSGRHGWPVSPTFQAMTMYTSQETMPPRYYFRERVSHQFAK